MCWGSFLNVVGYRVLRNQSLIPRSACPSCNTVLPWYHLIPLFSWIFLRGRCAFCATPISWLYPTVELLSGTVLTLLYASQPCVTFAIYFIFVSALLVTFRTDIEHQLILNCMSQGIIPLGLFASATHLIPLSILDSVLGILFGFGILWIVKTVFWHIKKQEGLGAGDPLLLAMIGSFTGPLGVWIILLIGSAMGSLIGICMLLSQKNASGYPLRLPFGAFLALGTMAYLLIGPSLAKIIIPA